MSFTQNRTKYTQSDPFVQKKIEGYYSSVNFFTIDCVTPNRKLILAHTYSTQYSYITQKTYNWCAEIKSNEFISFYICIYTTFAMGYTRGLLLLSTLTFQAPPIYEVSLLYIYVYNRKALFFRVFIIFSCNARAHKTLRVQKSIYTRHC